MFTKQADPATCRRRFLLAVASIASTSLGGSLCRASGEAAIQLRCQGQELYRVRIEMEIEGNVNVPKNPLVSRQGGLKLPVRSEAQFDYEERYHRSPGSDALRSNETRDADAATYVGMIERYYHQAERHSELNRRQQNTTLRDSVRSTFVRRELLPEVVYSAADYFQRDELELLHLPICSAALDELLPSTAVKVGESYAPSSEVMMSLLNLSAVQSTDVIAEMVSITESEARIKFRGDVQGSVDGVPTIVRVAGKLTFNRDQNTCTWLAMAIHETREPGKAEPGFDVAGTIKMIRKPISEPIGLCSDKPTLEIASPIPEQRLFVEIRSDRLGIEALMDRNWRMMTDIAGAAMMRRIDNEQSVAQCDFRPLAGLQPGQQWTLEALQEDVKRTLGNQLTGLTGADQQRQRNRPASDACDCFWRGRKCADPLGGAPFFRRLRSPRPGDLYNGRGPGQSLRRG